MFHISVIHHTSVFQSFSVPMMVYETKGIGYGYSMQRQVIEYH